MSILLRYAWTNVPIDLIFNYLDKIVSKVHIFHFTLRYENMNKSTPYLFRLICVSTGFSHSSSVPVTIVFAQNEIQTGGIENTSV